MELVAEQQRDRLHVLALLPAAREMVPLLRGRDQDRGLLEQLEVHRRLAREHLDCAAERPEALRPVRMPLLRDGGEGGEVDAPTVGFRHEHVQDGELGAHGLARAARCADEAILVGVEERREGLRLDRVEVREGVGVQSRLLLERRDGQRLQVEQLRVWRELIG